MSAPTIAPARVQVAPLDLDARLALTLLAMDDRLDQAGVAFEVNTAHIPSEPAVELDLVDQPAVAPIPQPASPLAAVYLGAIEVIRERGWVRGHLRDEAGAVCAVQAIRHAAATAGQADDACAHLLTVIQQEFPSAPTVPAWNDQQTSATPVLRILGTAADHAAQRGI